MIIGLSDMKEWRKNRELTAHPELGVLAALVDEQHTDKEEPKRRDGQADRHRDLGAERQAVNVRRAAVQRGPGSRPSASTPLSCPQVSHLVYQKQRVRDAPPTPHSPGSL